MARRFRASIKSQTKISTLWKYWHTGAIGTIVKLIVLSYKRTGRLCSWERSVSLVWNVFILNTAFHKHVIVKPRFASPASSEFSVETWTAKGLFENGKEAWLDNIWSCFQKAKITLGNICHSILSELQRATGYSQAEMQTFTRRFSW